MTPIRAHIHRRPQRLPQDPIQVRRNWLMLAWVECKLFGYVTEEAKYEWRRIVKGKGKQDEQTIRSHASLQQSARPNSQMENNADL